MIRVFVMMLALLSIGAGYRTENFVVTAHDANTAKVMAETAEISRIHLAEEWLGRKLPKWTSPCNVVITVNQTNGGGVTEFKFASGQPRQLSGRWSGSRRALVEDVIPHEVMHTVLASHFGRPLPRWIDEGICTAVESGTAKQRQHKVLRTVLSTGRGIPFNHMFAMRQYPADILPLYAQGWSTSEYLLTLGSQRDLINFTARYANTGRWTESLQEHYEINDLSDLQVRWIKWVKEGHTVRRSRGKLGHFLPWKWSGNRWTPGQHADCPPGGT